MYNFQIVSGVFKDREIKQGLKLRPSYDEAIEENVENPMLEQYTATGVFKSQKFQNILNNDIENLDILQRSKIRSDLIKRDLIDGGVDIHQAQEQAIQQVRQPIIAQVQDPFENIEGTLEEMYDALDTHEKTREESRSSSSAMVNRQMIEQLSKDYVNDLVNRMQTQIKTKEAPKDEKVEEVEEVEEVEPKEEKPKSKSGMMAPPKSGMFPPLYAGGSGEQPSSSSSAPAVRTRQRSRSADPKRVGGSGEAPEDEEVGVKYTGSIPPNIDDLLNLPYVSSSIKKELESISKDKTKKREQPDLLNLQKTKRELMGFGVTELMIQAHHSERQIKFEDNSKKDKKGKIIKATEITASGINQNTNEPFKLTFKTSTGSLTKDNYVDILRSYEPYKK